MNTTVCQEVLVDKRESGKERPWAVHKVSNTYLAIAYDEVDLKKAQRLRNCASWLEFTRTAEGGLKLHNANFCRVRLCPICAWRRSLKTYGQVRKIISAMPDNYEYIFVTLTIRNCEPEFLTDTLNQMSKAWDKFVKYKDIKPVMKGFYRATEVTHNLADNTYHPHFHCLIAVNKSYITSRYYLKWMRWRELWGRALGVNYLPHVWVNKVKAADCYYDFSESNSCNVDPSKGFDKVCAEVAKYAVKSNDILILDDWDLTVETVQVLDKALNKRRFIAFGGLFKELHKKLNLDDVEEGDYIHLDDDEASAAEVDEKIFYAWHSGYCQYYRQ